MKKFLLLICLTSSFSLLAQDYQLLNMNRQSHFGGMNFVIAPDSISWNGTNATFFFNSKIDLCQSELRTMYEHHLYPFLTHPVQYNTISGVYTFQTDSSETLTMHTRSAVGDKWILYTYANGDYLEIEHVSTTVLPVLGVQDSVKHLGIWSRDSSGNVLTGHPWHGKGMLISKSYGWYRTHNIDRFPYNSQTLYLYGITEPQLGLQRLTAENIYDFEPGDILHVEESGGTSEGYPVDSVYEKFHILSRSESATEDTIIYQVWRRKIFNSWQDNDWIQTNDTIPWVIPKHSLSQVPARFYDVSDDSLLNTWMKPDDVGIVNTWEDTIYGRSAKYYNSLWINDPDGQVCIISNHFESDREEYGIEGLGGGYFNRSSFVNYTFRRPVYYKKDTVEWGIPIEFSDFILSHDPGLPQFQVKLFPNPTRGEFQLHFPEDIKGILRLYSRHGQLVWEESFHEDQLSLDLSGHTSGLYFLSIQSNKGSYSGRVVKE